MRIAVIAVAGLLAATGAGAAGELSVVPDEVQRTPAPAPSAGSLPPHAAGEVRALAEPPARSRNELAAGRPPYGRACFSQAETREKIAMHRLADPVRAFRVGRLQGEALSAKLCRWKPDEFVYEVHVLHADGRVLRIYVNAQSGELLGGPRTAERTRK